MVIKCLIMSIQYCNNGEVAYTPHEISSSISEMTIFEARREGELSPELAEARRDIERMEEVCHGMGEALGMEWISHGFAGFEGSSFAFLFSNAPDASEESADLALVAENDLTVAGALELLRKEMERRQGAPAVSAA